MYTVTLGNGDTADAQTIPDLLEAAITIAEEADWPGVRTVTILGEPSKALTAVVRRAVLEASPRKTEVRPYDWELTGA